MFLLDRKKYIYSICESFSNISGNSPAVLSFLQVLDQVNTITKTFSNGYLSEPDKPVSQWVAQLFELNTDPPENIFVLMDNVYTHNSLPRELT